MDAQSMQKYRAAEQALWAEVGWAPEESWVDFDGVRIRTLSSGSGDPVVFVHGGPNAGSTWTSVAGPLSDSFRVHVIDRPGCGLSDPLPPTNWSTPEELWDLMGRMVSAVVDQNTDGHAHLVASSFGGACALALASSRPEQVDRLVLEGAPAVDGMHAPMNMRMLGFGPLGRFIARQKSTRGTTRRTFRQIGHKRLVDSGWPTGPGLEWGLSMMNDTDTMRNEVALIQSGSSWRGFRPGWLLDPTRLSDVKARTLWLVGDSEPFAPADLLQSWSDTIPDSRIITREGSGHLPWMDDPEYHVRTIREFLQAD
ncbi:MAG: alpha/beta hydrolase [Actinobacteria bacterium]|nr:alpha/beta hydrolase [Actinomycetota bacterium]